MKTGFYGLLLMAVCCSSCANRVYLNRINSFFNSASVAVKSGYMADDYRSYFQEKKGAGKDKASSLQSFQNWDGQLEPDIKILGYRHTDSTWTVKFNEQNDFSKLIGFPGWKGGMSITFNAKGMICETIYRPDDSNPSYKPWLQPAVDWLSINNPAELSIIYKDNKLVQTERTAIMWKALLQKWKSQAKK